MQEIIEKIKTKKPLTENEIKTIVKSIEKNTFDKKEMKEFLILMNEKEITSTELYYFINELYSKANKINLNENDCVDVCGTGGDRTNTFNISTASMFVAAGAGVKIAKHGNRSISSNSGSFDVLETLGINIENCSQKANESLNSANIALFFAPIHHPVFKNIGEVRREIGKTIFNMMGPLLNPANISKQLIGVFDPKLTELIANTLEKKGLDRALIVHGEGLDEITITGKTKISELKNGKIKTYTISPEQFGIKINTLDSIIVNSKEESAKIILSVLNDENSAAKDIVLLNSGAIIYLSGLASSINEGIEKARVSITSKAAINTLEKLKKILKKAE